MPLHPGKTRADALVQAIAMRKLLWSRSDWLSLPEDRRIGELERFCTGLYGGDRRAGAALAVDAIYRDTPLRS